MTNAKEKQVVKKEDEEITEVLPEVAAAAKTTAASSATTTNKSTATVADATFKSTSVALIEKLLQFSTPRLDVKIVNVLFLEGNFNHHGNV